jgi:hypothetical protein
MAKIINIDIDESTGDLSVDLDGFHGKGCAEVSKAFETLGKVKVSKKKREFTETCQQKGRTQ